MRRNLFDWLVLDAVIAGIWPVNYHVSPPNHLRFECLKALDTSILQITHSCVLRNAIDSFWVLTFAVMCDDVCS